MLSYTKKAIKFTEEILNDCIRNIKKFRTEKEVYLFLVREARKRKLRLAFKPLVVTSPNGFEIHHKPTDTSLKKGFLILDYGLKYKGYCADITRTVYLGEPSEKDIYLYNLVLTAHDEAFKNLKLGMDYASIDQVARQILIKYKKNFRHALGHGVGRRVHQSPKVGPNNYKKLKENQIITIEPGIYFKNSFGIRIEDMVLVKDKPVYLTKISRRLISSPL